MRTIPALLFLGAALILSSCAGYRLGNIKSAELKEVRTIYVPVAKNKSIEPGLSVMVTNAILRRIDNDGTYSSARTTSADSELEVTIKDVVRTPLRQDREDYTLTTRYEIRIIAKVTFTNRVTGKRVFTDREVSGKTTYFFQDDMQESERQSLPVAAEDLAYNIVTLVSEGW